jgi:hypothetical protein
MELEFYLQIFENPQISNIMRVCPVGGEFQCGQTDMTKPIFSFRNIANAPEKQVRHLRRRVISLFVSGDMMDSLFLPDTFQCT